MRIKLLLFAILILPLSGWCGDNSSAGAKYDPSNRSQVPWRTTDDGNGNQSLHVVVDSGGGGGGAATIADGADVTQGAKADAKSTATDTTPVTIVSILKQISASVQAPPSQAVTGPVTDTQLRATAVPVSLPATQYAIAISSVTTSGSVAAGKHHIEFVLSADFAGTIGGATINPAILSVYNPGDAPVGTSFAALSYTISAGSAVLTTW